MGPAAPGHDRLDRRVEDALDDEARQKMHDEADAEIQHAVEFARESPLPDPDELRSFVYGD